MSKKDATKLALGLSVFVAGAFALAGADLAAASSDDVRNAHAKQDCVRGMFKDYYLQGEGGDPPDDYTGRVFKLSQDYPDQLPPMEDYPWLAIEFENGGPTDPKAYLEALLAYGVEGNIEVDFYVEDNTVRDWYSMPWMDWNTEVAGDWPGTDGREFVHGLTHEFDSFPKTFSTIQGKFVDTWSGAYYNDRGGFAIGQVYCDPDSPDPSALNPDPTGLNNFPDGSYIIKLLFSTVQDEQLPTMVNSLVWQADRYVEQNPEVRNEGPLSKYDREVQPVRMLQIDVAVRDDRSLTGWLFGTFAYDGTRDGETPWDRMVTLGLQWGSDPSVTYADSCDADGNCDESKLTQQWINMDALKELTANELSLDHLGYGGRLAGPVDNPQAACMGCHQTAGFPATAIEPAASTLAPVLGITTADSVATHQDFQMSFYRNVQAGTVFSDSQLYSADYSLQMAMSLTNFSSLRCTVDVADKPEICDTLTKWAEAMRAYVDNTLTFGAPGAGGAPLEVEGD